MLVIDAQVHVWGPDTPDRPWTRGAEALADGVAAYSVDQLDADMRQAGVDAAVLVPPGAWEGYHNDIVLEAATRRPRRFAAMVNIDPVMPQARAQLRELFRNPATRGLRLGLSQGERREAFARGRLDWLWRDVADRQLPTAIFVPGMLEQADKVARDYPTLPLALCHLSLNLRRLNPDVEAVVDQLLRLADRPNVSVKASAIPLQSAQAYPFADMHRPLQRVIAAFGPERVFWGSDHTRYAAHAEHGADYLQARQLFTDHLPFLDPTARALVMGGALQRWLHWPEAGSPEA
jgi:L-fuconolactonase